MVSKSTSGSAGALVREHHLLQRVAAQPEPKRLERDHLVGRDVPKVDLGPELLHEPGLRRLRGRLEDQVARVDVVDDLVDQAGAHLAGRTEDAGRPALARLGDHLPGAGFELFLDPLHPEVGREVDLGVLGADLGQDREVAREVGDQLELFLARDLDRAVGDLDVRQAEVGEPALVLVDLVLDVYDLEERAADDDGLAAQYLELPAQVRCDVRGAPAELDDVDVDAGGLEDVLPAARAEALVEDVREAARSWLKVQQGFPPVASWLPSERRGTSSCRASRCRPRAGRSPSRGTSRGTRA